MRKKLYRLLTWPFFGKLPSLIFVKRTAWPGAGVMLVDREEFEYIIKKMRWQWLRGFLLGITLVVVVGVGGFLFGLTTAWPAEQMHLKRACTQIINMACQKPHPPLSPLSPLKIYWSRSYVGANPLY